uniref:Uncharacterized protein n=1 Tax=uncultured marine virus TaxID=186617 RepID=A0A0F7L675_9VIRU|nr:hypothetical protein [uncultured marine virus]
MYPRAWPIISSSENPVYSLMSSLKLLSQESTTQSSTRPPLTALSAIKESRFKWVTTSLSCFRWPTIIDVSHQTEKPCSLAFLQS